MEGLQKICKALNCDVGDICVVNDVNSAKFTEANPIIIEK